MLRAIPIKHINTHGRHFFDILMVEVVLEKGLLMWEGYALNSLLAVEGHLIIWLNSLLTTDVCIWDIILIGSHLTEKF